MNACDEMYLIEKKRYRERRTYKLENQNLFKTQSLKLFALRKSCVVDEREYVSASKLVV